MNLQELLTLSEASKCLSTQVTTFSNVCEQLCALTEHENELFMDGSQGVAAVSMRKVVMLEKFEQQACSIIEIIKKEAPHNLALQHYVIDKIQILQAKLKVNTSLQLHEIANLQSKLTGSETSKLCH